MSASPEHVIIQQPSVLYEESPQGEYGGEGKEDSGLGGGVCYGCDVHLLQTVSGVQR